MLELSQEVLTPHPQTTPPPPPNQTQISANPHPTHLSDNEIEIKIE